MQSAALMLAHIGERAAAQTLQSAVERVYAEGKHLTRDVGGTAGTAEFTDAVIRCVGQALPPANNAED
jgi:isocitrate dehydrogenase (NAD+)